MPEHPRIEIAASLAGEPLPDEIDDDRRAIFCEAACKTHGAQPGAGILLEAIDEDHLALTVEIHHRQFAREIIRSATERSRSNRTGGGSLPCRFR